ncbi:ornithine cyclodeaminase family protein [Aestuariibius sp. HNIBRBA575]|uniref:ornithine cyclodeaminase family protein n=1 Tax=Aestuariibius sp. HNIBRBA575 TaxID=3233343 RepID=UPI0034A4CF09
MTAPDQPRYISRADFDRPIDWLSLTEALKAGHRLPKARVEDVFLGEQGSSLLSRSAWIDGLGFGVKSVTVFAQNPAQGLPSVQGAMLLFDPAHGGLRAVIDSGLVTDLKTAADSALGARYLARPDSETMLVIGAGAVAGNVISAYAQLFPSLRHISIWNRTHAKAEALAQSVTSDQLRVTAIQDLPQAASHSDIIVTATMSITPILLGDWVQPGTHVDLIGAFRAEMREADDALLQKGRIFVDSRDTTIHHIGELKIPIAAGVISRADVLADFYDFADGYAGRTSAQDITIFKNGGGAHLDVMTADAILDAI